MSSVIVVPWLVSINNQSLEVAVVANLLCPMIHAILPVLLIPLSFSKF